MTRSEYAHVYSRFLGNGVPYGALVDTLARIGSWSEWCAEWIRTGERFESNGDVARDAGRGISARDHYLAAAACYHYGEYLFSQDMELKLATLHRCVDAFQKAIPYIAPAIERVEVPFAGAKLPAYFCSAGEGRRPCVIQIQGLDSIKEVETYYSSRNLVERGIATLMFDGPGQSEGWERLKMGVHYEEAVSAVLDYLVAKPDVDADAIGVFGGSLGGYLSMRAAATDGRIRAAIGLAGPFDMREWVARTPPDRQERVRLAWGVESVPELLERMEGATLARLPAVRCPLLIVHGDADKVVPVEEARRIHGWAPANSQLVIFGGGDHNCSNRRIECGTLIADWLAETLLRF